MKRWPVTFPPATVNRASIGGDMTLGDERAAVFARHHDCVHWATGQDNIDRDAASLELFREDQRPSLERGFGRPVRHEALAHHRQNARRDVDDAPPFLLAEDGHDGARHGEGAAYVHSKKASPQIIGYILDLEMLVVVI